MLILVFNCGSSSLKYRLIAMPEEKELAGGEAQRVGPPTAKPSRLIHRTPAREVVAEIPMRNHAEALAVVMQTLQEEGGVLPDVLAHRLVNGGAALSDCCLVDDAVMVELEKAGGLAPVHNPPTIATMMACRERFPAIPQVVVSDTAFHRTIPEYARAYAIPRSIAREHGIRKYGYHGISHQYVMTEAARLLGIPLEQFNAVSCHLGSGGASLCAIVNGQSVDNTMGWSPLQGLVMSTRCGDLDPGLTLRFVADACGDTDAVENRLNKASGVLGLSGRSADLRDSLDAAHGEGPTARDALLAVHVYLWRLRKYLGSYLAIVGTPHAVIFTDTIGETVPAVRHAVCADMEHFGLSLDFARNLDAGKLPADVAAPDSPVRILVILTNEELSIARSAFRVMTEN
jgi:acetate kinase